MSVQIKQIAEIIDVSIVRRHLFPTDDNRGGDGWLQSTLVSVSPSGDVIAFAHNKRLVVSSGRWDNHSTLSQFTTNDANLHDFKDTISAVLCLPIVIQSQSSQVGPDWTCIAIAFNTGYISFYTENCTLLFEEKLHNEPISALKCQSQHSPQPDISSELKPEELYVVYESNICVINGSQLFATLRTCRSNLAKGIPNDPTQISLASKKWAFIDQAQVSDVAVVGLDLQNTFDHLQTASLCGGFATKYRAMPPYNSLVLGGGAKPFLGFHYALEGGSQPVLSDVAKAVASKLKSALPGWLTGAKSTPDKSEAVALTPAEAMACRFGLCDHRRAVTRLVLSPDRRLAALSDALGRVLLIDTHRGVASRVFKGYRDAQCAFIQVPDERKTRKSTKKAIALFLAIYSPKKGTVEIFCAQQGSKIATFTAAKTSLLIYINYGLMGFQNTSKSRYVCQFTCLLMDADGRMKEMIIPFHFALAEKNSKRARDIHLYKRLKQLVKGTNDAPESDRILTEALTTFNELKTIEVSLQCIEMLVNSREITADVIIACCAAILERYQLISDKPVALDERDDKEKEDLRVLLRVVENLSLLSHFYNFLTNSGSDLDVKNGNYCKTSPNTPNLLGTKEMTNLQRLLDLSTLNDYKMQPRVKFESNKDVNLSQFVRIFDYTAPPLLKIKNGDDPLLYNVAEQMFATYINECANPELEIHAKKSSIQPEHLFSLLLLYWVNRPLDTFQNLESEMHNFSATVHTLTKVFDPSDVSVAYNCVSEFWTRVREDLENSHKPFPALMAAVLCKGVAQRIEAEKDLQQSSVEDESVDMWEKLSQENCQWTLLIGKLEDVSLLNIILSNKPICASVLPKLDLERHDVSLKYILERGKGSVSETVAQWLCQGGVNPEDILLDDLRQSTNADGEGQSRQLVSRSEESQEPVFYHLGIIKKQFPHSLEPSVLLANMCWEYALAWQKDVSNLRLLEAALRCLVHIPNLHIKTGIYNLVWNTHLKIIFEAASKLINKVGKLPKERLCRQDTDLSDYQITLFYEFCVGFFDVFMETVLESFSYQKPALQYEAIWENGGTAPLTELALAQNAINYDLVHLHYQLAMILHMMTVFAVKHTKVLTNLFDTPMNNLFFSDFQVKSEVNTHNRADSKTTASRLQFLLKVISASMDTVTMNDGRIYSSDHVAWMAKCLTLARLWDLDVDLLKRYQIAQILSAGFDSFAIDLLPTVTEKAKLGPDLVKIAGKRLAQLLASSRDLGEQIAACSTKVTKYLAALDGDWCAPSDLESNMMLLTHALRCLEEAQPEHKMACLMLEACSTLQDLNS